MIEILDVHKSFEDKEVLKGINAQFENGKTNLIIGQSGSGKTVLLKCVVGLFEPTQGDVVYDGRSFVNMNKRERALLRREMGMIFQSAALFDSLSVLENVMFPLDMFSNDSYADRKRRAEFCLDRVNLLEAANKYPGELSGGMQKRVAIARAIVLNPKYLFCDEPNSGLDPKTSLVIDDLIHSITHEYNMTTIINTHDMNSVMGIGEQILFINEGYGEWTGTKDEVMSANNEKLNSFIFMPVFGLNNGSVSILAYNYGARKRARMIDCIKRVALYALCIMSVGTLIFQTVPQLLLRLFNATDTLLAVGVPTLRIISISFPIAAICIALGGAFQATGKSIYSMLVSFVRQLIFLIPAAFVLALIGRNVGNSNLVWWSYPIAEIVSLAISLFFYFRLHRTLLSKLPEHGESTEENQ